MDKDKRSVQASWWEGLAMGTTGSCSVLSKSLNQLSAGQCGCAPSLLAVWPEVTQSWSLQAPYKGYWWPPKGLMPTRTSQDCCCYCPCPHSRPLPIQASAEGLQHSQAGLAPFPVESLILSPGSWCTQDFVCAFQKSLFPPVLWKVHNQIPLTFQVRFPGDSPALCWIPRLGSLMWGLKLLQQGENFFGPFVLQFAGHLPGGYGILFYHGCGPPTVSLWFLLCPWTRGMFFLVGSNILLSMCVQQLVVIWVHLQEEMSTVLLLCHLGSMSSLARPGPGGLHRPTHKVQTFQWLEQVH